MQIPSPAKTGNTGKTQQFRDDLDQSRRRGTLQPIPPCPQGLLKGAGWACHLQAAMAWLHIGREALSHWAAPVNAQFDAA